MSVVNKRFLRRYRRDYVAIYNLKKSFQYNLKTGQMRAFFKRDKVFIVRTQDLANKLGSIRRQIQIEKDTSYNNFLHYYINNNDVKTIIKQYQDYCFINHYYQKNSFNLLQLFIKTNQDLDYDTLVKCIKNLKLVLNAGIINNTLIHDIQKLLNSDFSEQMIYQNLLVKLTYIHEECHKAGMGFPADLIPLYNLVVKRIN